MSRLVLYGYDSIEVGGVQNLHVLIAKQFIKEGFEVLFFGQKDSYALKRMRELSIEVLHVDTDQVKRKLWGSLISGEDYLLVTSFTKDLRPFIGANPKIVFWSVDPSVFRMANEIDLLFGRKRTMKLISVLRLKCALVFMDLFNYDALKEDYGFCIENPKLLPIPVNEALVKRDTRVSQLGELNISYIGRGDAIWKVKPFIKVLSDIERIASNTKINVFIYTNILELYKREIELLHLTKCNIKFKKNIVGERLSKSLIDNVDLSFAMGTSALESAKLGIPTILLDASFKDMPEDYRYKWLYQTKGFNLGNFIDLYPAKADGMRLDSVLDVVESNWGSVSNLSHEYVSLHHTSLAIVKELISCFQNSEARLTDITNNSLRQSIIVQLILKKVPRAKSGLKFLRENFRITKKKR